MTDELGPITEVEIELLRKCCERARALYSPEEHARIAEVIETFAELRAMVVELDGADGDTILDESFLEQAIGRARARLSR
jgi:hypothetical protein